MLGIETSHGLADGLEAPIGSPEATLLANLTVLDEVTRFLARRHLLSSAEADDLGSRVKLKLIENDYEAIRKFQGRSSLRTYLTVVAQRVYLDQRDAELGKWRPSMEAKRLGPLAVRLEALIARDGLEVDEACRMVRTGHSVPESEGELRALAQKLPVRVRRRFVSEEAIAGMPAAGTAADALVEAHEGEAALRKARAALRAALGPLPPQDRLVLRMRFVDSFQIAEIAAALRLEAKPLYKRLERLLSHLRERLAAAGVDKRSVLDLLDRPSSELAAGLSGGGIASGRPSISRGEDS